MNNMDGKESISFIEKELFPDTSQREERERNNSVKNEYKIGGRQFTQGTLSVWI